MYLNANHIVNNGINTVKSVKTDALNAQNSWFWQKEYNTIIIVYMLRHKSV